MPPRWPRGSAEAAPWGDRRPVIAVTAAVASQSGAQGGQSPAGPEFQAKNNVPVTVKIGMSGYQRLECFIATLPT